MTDLLDSPTASPVATATWPKTIVCGTDGTREAREAVRQAAELAIAGATVALISIIPGHGFADDSATAKADAERITHALQVPATFTATEAATAAAGLLTAAWHADVLVVGCDALGPTPRAIVRHARGPVLLARRLRDVSLWDRILVAADAKPRTQAVADQLAADHGADLLTAPAIELVSTAAELGCGMIIIGHGATAIQVAQLAPCSVLVVRDDDDC